jgi:predicted ribosome quality control (RQC) complex YloA/Tae2 family protein
MYFDYFTTAALLDELKTTLLSGRIQDIIEMDEVSLGLEIYANHARHYLYITADPEQPRLHRVQEKLRRGVTVPSPLGLLLNRHIEGGQITAIRHPPWERIIIFDILTLDGAFSLIVEPIERRANILLVENEIIRECIRRVGAEENRVRQLLPGQVYQFPPPQQKLDPSLVTLNDLQALDPQAKLAQVLTKNIHGFSPLLGREVAFRATGNINGKVSDTTPQNILDTLQKLILPLMKHEWQPGYVIEDEAVMAYAVYPITHLPHWRPAESLSGAMEAYYGTMSGERAYDAARAPIRKQIKLAENRLNGKLYSLKQQERAEDEIERLRQSGELLLTYQHYVQPQQTLFMASYDPNEEPLPIKLDPLLTPVQNAQRYFEKYEKAKRSRAALPDLILETERELRYLAQLETDLDLATNWNDIGEVQDALIAAGYWQGKRRRQTTSSGKSAPMRIMAEDGTIIWVGRNARQNEEVTFTKGSADDLWLHARGIPGAHVIIKSNGRRVAEAVLLKAAELAAYYSRGRGETAVEVMVTERKYVQKIKGGKPGMVRVTKQTHSSLKVIPRPE